MALLRMLFIRETHSTWLSALSFSSHFPFGQVLLPAEKTVLRLQRQYRQDSRSAFRLSVGWYKVSCGAVSSKIFYTDLTQNR